MITCEWRDRLTAAEADALAAVLARAADCDADKGYNTIDMDDVREGLGRPDVKHLVIWFTACPNSTGRKPELQRIVGLLRLEFTGRAEARATVVVDPQLRSRGILSALLDYVSAVTNAADGWAGTGAHVVTAWARGDHPAVRRVTDRTFMAGTRRMWRLVRPAETGEGLVAAPPLERISTKPKGSNGQLFALREHGAVVGLISMDLQGVDIPSLGHCGTIACVAYNREFAPEVVRRMLAGAVRVVSDTGLDGVTIYVNSDDLALITACRQTAFEHDRTDVLYQRLVAS
jgi:hypothetical protein